VPDGASRFVVYSFYFCFVLLVVGSMVGIWLLLSLFSAVHSLRFLWFGRVSFVLAILCCGCFWGLLLGQAYQHFMRLALLYCLNSLVLLLRFWVLIS